MTKTATKEQAALFAEPQSPPETKSVVATEKPTKAKAPKTTAIAKVTDRKGPLSDEASDEIATLLRVVLDPNCDVAKAERVEQMIERARAKRAKIYYDRAYNAMKEELPEINKDNKIVIEKGGRVIQSTPYASYPNIQRVTGPILRRHGFTLEHTTIPGKDNIGIVIVSTLSYSHGLDYRHSKIAELPLKIENSGSKNDTQGVSSSISYGKRINSTTLLDLITFAPQDADLDGNKRAKAGMKAEPQGDGKIDAEQLAELTKAIEDCGVGLETFGNKYEVQKIADLPAAMFDEAMAACARFKKARQANG